MHSYILNVFCAEQTRQSGPNMKKRISLFEIYFILLQ